MKLYFFRHAEAEPGLSNDFERRLTRRGSRRTETAAQVLLALGISPAHIYTSPRIRARQTAEILADALDMDVELEDGLDFGFNLDVVERLAEGIDEGGEVMFVGHEPSMSDVVSDLIGGEVVMKKGGMARVDVTFFASPLEGELVWLIAPRVFDVLGSG
jgi:phosphohistidine phosphatase